ncbi:MAG: hypothetical protein LBD95_02605, partial [Clostridiales Family XIII bacterium]|nr:hypothetical protein [Clostridiales Family XIII bacterium]
APLRRLASRVRTVSSFRAHHQKRKAKQKTARNRVTTDANGIQRKQTRKTRTPAPIICALRNKVPQGIIMVCSASGFPDMLSVW